MNNEINIYKQGNVELLFCSSTHSFPLHSHESWCIGMVTEGEVLFGIHDEECLLKRGMLYVIPSNKGVRIIAKKKYNYTTICFKSELVDYFNTCGLEHYFMQLLDIDDFQKPCYDFMWNGEENKFAEEILALIQPMFKKNQFDTKPSVSDAIKSAVENIRKLNGEKFDLNHIATVVNLSKYHLIRQFKKEMGVTPNQFYIQNKLRIVKAEILANQAEADIAAELNYADQSHLCRQFKKMMGISLQEYKRNMRSK
jgi:AraC-like DNA-binding protein